MTKTFKSLLAAALRTFRLLGRSFRRAPGQVETKITFVPPIPPPSAPDQGSHQALSRLAELHAETIEIRLTDLSHDLHRSGVTYISATLVDRPDPDSTTSGPRRIHLRSTTVKNSPISAEIPPRSCY